MSLRRLLGLAILAAVLAPTGARAAGGGEHSGSHPHHLALFLGTGLETKSDNREKDKGFAIGYGF